MCYTQERIVINTGATTCIRIVSINDNVNNGIIVPRDDALHEKKFRKRARSLPRIAHDTTDR